ncbi:hypothetical protein AB0P45_15960 [Streptomyces niveus]
MSGWGYTLSAVSGYQNLSVYCAELEYLIRHVQGPAPAQLGPADGGNPNL